MLKLENQEKKLDHLTKTFESQTAAIKNVQNELNILRQENHAKIEDLKNDIKKTRNRIQDCQRLSQVPLCRGSRASVRQI